MWKAPFSTCATFSRTRSEWEMIVPVGYLTKFVLFLRASEKALHEASLLLGFSNFQPGYVLSSRLLSYKPPRWCILSLWLFISLCFRHFFLLKALKALCCDICTKCSVVRVLRFWAMAIRTHSFISLPLIELDRNGRCESVRSSIGHEVRALYSSKLYCIFLMFLYNRLCTHIFSVSSCCSAHHSVEESLCTCFNVF